MQPVNELLYTNLIPLSKRSRRRSVDVFNPTFCLIVYFVSLISLCVFQVHVHDYFNQLSVTVSSNSFIHINVCTHYRHIYINNDWK